MAKTSYASLIHTEVLLPPRTLPKDLNNAQLVYLFSNHPILRRIEYHHDIGRFKGINSYLVITYDNVDLYSTIYLITEAKLSGNELLSLDKGSFERLQFSSGFHTPLLKVIEDLVCHQ